jgi:DNA-directed RNA polymerase alpha subunit
MSYFCRCDYCGEAIEDGDRRVTISAKGENRDGGKADGYIGHYHNTYGRTCYRTVLDAMQLASEWREVVEREPLYSRPLLDLRRRHTRVCDEEALAALADAWIGQLDLKGTTYEALSPHVSTIGELCALTTDQLLALPKIGGPRADEIIEALAARNLALVRGATQDPTPPSRRRKPPPPRRPRLERNLPAREVVLGWPFEELDISVRAYNLLLRHDATTLGELTQVSRIQLAAIIGMGPTTLDEIEVALADLGLALKTGQQGASS